MTRARKIITYNDFVDSVLQSYDSQVTMYSISELSLLEAEEVISRVELERENKLMEFFRRCMSTEHRLKIIFNFFRITTTYCVCQRTVKCDSGWLNAWLSVKTWTIQT